MTGRICDYIQRQPVILYGNIRRKFLGAVQIFGSDTLVVAELVKASASVRQQSLPNHGL